MPRQGGVVVACNHNLGPDYVILGYASPRQIYYMAKMEIFAWHPWLTRFFRAVGTFPVNRGKGDVEAFKTAVELVQSGRVIGMFPEGTRSRTGQLMRGKSGAVRIAMQAGAPITPAVVINSSLFFKRLGRLWDRPQITVRFGPPLDLPGNPEDPADVRANTEKMMRAIAALLPKELRGVYSEEQSVKSAIENEESEGVKN